MAYQLKNSLDSLRLKLIEEEIAKRKRLVDIVLVRIDNNLARQILTTSLTAEEEQYSKTIIKELESQDFKCSYHSSEPGDSFEPMDYGSSAYIKIKL